MIKTVLFRNIALLAAVAALSSATAAESCKAELFIALPDCVNTPDGMALLRDGSIIVSAPNFNDQTKPPLLVRVTGVTGKTKAEKFYEFPTPYPGLPKGADRIAPMGNAPAPNGDLYMADMQYAKDKIQKSRLWRLVVKHGKVEKMVLVASGFNVANGTVIHGGYCYITESVLEEDSHPLTSAVMRFKLDEENVILKTPLKNDPHIITTFKSYKDQWRFGADGIEFDNQGNLYVGLFGEGDSLALPLQDHGTLKTCYGAHNRKHEGCHRGIFPGKGQRLFDEFNLDFPVGKIRDDPEQVSQVAGQAVHGVTDQRIAFARPFESGL